MPEAVVSVEGAHEEEPQVSIDEEDQYGSPARQVRQGRDVVPLWGRKACAGMKERLCIGIGQAYAVAPSAVCKHDLHKPITSAAHSHSPTPHHPHHSPAHPQSPLLQLVAEMMILAGEAVGELGRRLGVPLPYRGQAEPVLPDADELAAGGRAGMRQGRAVSWVGWGVELVAAACNATGGAGSLVIIQSQAACSSTQTSSPCHTSAPPATPAVPAGPCQAVLLRMRMTRSVMATALPLRHAGLGLEAYVQFTSPIRR